MRSDLESALEECLARMQAGEGLDACLNRHRGYAAELRPLLVLAADVRQLPLPRARPAVKAAHEQRMLAAVAARFPAPAPRPTLRSTPQRGLALRASEAVVDRLRTSFSPRPVLRWGMALAIVLVLFLSGSWLSTWTAADSLPGDALYPLKRANEQFQLWLTWDPAAQQQLESEFSQKRLEETHTVLIQNRQTRVEFEGELSQVSASYWVVGGIKVTLTLATRIEGRPNLGAQVQVQAQAPGDGTLLAVRLRVEPTPLPRATATLTATLTATPSPRPSHTPAPPTSTFGPRPTQTPSPTAQPTSTAHHTPRPTKTLKPTPRPTLPPRHTPWPTFPPHPTPHPTLPPRHTPYPTFPPYPTPHPTFPPYPTPRPTPPLHHTPRPTPPLHHTPRPTPHP